MAEISGSTGPSPQGRCCCSQRSWCPGDAGVAQVNNEYTRVWQSQVTGPARCTTVCEFEFWLYQVYRKEKLPDIKLPQSTLSVTRSRMLRQSRHSQARETTHWCEITQARRVWGSSLGGAARRAGSESVSGAVTDVQVRTSRLIRRPSVNDSKPSVPRPETRDPMIGRTVRTGVGAIILSSMKQNAHARPATLPLACPWLFYLYLAMLKWIWAIKKVIIWVDESVYARHSLNDFFFATRI